MFYFLPRLGLIVRPFCTALLLCVCFLSHAQEKPYKVHPKSPEESLKTIVVQDGYKLELVAAEPLVQEPVLVAFDGNGRIYVAEMLTYMQDVDATGQLNPVSRIVRLEDTNNDGVIDKSTVFADNLLLPRMVQTLGDGQILVGETNTLDLMLITDVNGDGVSDRREVVYKGGPRGGNIEHQPSGLIWNIDNWMYVTYTEQRYKYRGGKVSSQNIAYGGGQWGLGQDEIGRLFYSSAGGENPAFSFQFPPVYGKIHVPVEQEEGFREVFPLDKTPDVQAGKKDLRDDNTLKRFTGVGGQSVYLGDKLPDLYGKYIAPEPVGNLVRLAEIKHSNGYSVLSHPYQAEKKEFLASADPNFRPVWSDTAPDGSLVIVDMYRGIIQESNWTPKGSYLRGVIQDYGFDKVIGRGRIYRVTKPGIKLDKAPQMYRETPAELVKHLSHPNGWWRLTAQKLIVISQDLSVTAALQSIARKNENPLARLHALWTLDGLGVIDRKLLIEKFKDNDPRVVTAAIRISEQLIKKQDTSIALYWLKAAQSDNIDIAQQALLSALYVDLNDTLRSEIRSTVLKKFSTTLWAAENILGVETESVIERKFKSALKRVSPAQALVAINTNILYWSDEKGKLQKPLLNNEAQLETVVRGGKIFKELCSTCHGESGGGAPSGGGLIAPSFIGNQDVKGSLAILLRIAIHGLSGPIDGRVYTGGIMPALRAENDFFIADSLSYIRNSFTNSSGIVKPEQIAAVKKLESSRSTPWTINELYKLFKYELGNKTQWKLSSSHEPKTISRINDGQLNGAAWRSGSKNASAIWLQVELPKTSLVSNIRLSNAYSKLASPRHYTVEFSVDGFKWEKVAESNSEGYEATIETLGYPTKFVRISSLNGSPNDEWILDELYIYGSEV